MKERTQERRERMIKVLENRKADIRVLLCNLRNEHNISAILRSCDFMGIQYMDIITEKFSSDDFPFNKQITKGVEKWMDISFYEQTEEYLSWVKDSGYKLYLTMLSEDAHSFRTTAVDGKLIFGFGSEGLGFKEKDIIAAASGNVIIDPMGFSQSLNVSVSVGMMLTEICSRRKVCPLSASVKESLLKKWMEL